MIWLSLALAIVALCFAAVLLFGAPYLPTLDRQVSVALELSGLEPGDILLELGCGDGKVVVAAARRGIKVVGYELNPILATVAWLRTRRYGGQVQIIWGDFWRKEWPRANTAFVFLLPKYMSKLDKKFMQYRHKPVKLVSFAFAIPGKELSAQQDGVYLYEYPK